MTKDILAKYYCAADVFCLPTREDIWGLVINEAMGYGLPVVTTDRCIAGLEMIRNGENGFLISSDDEKSLREKLMFILRDDVMCRKMGKHSLATVKEYTIEKMAVCYSEVLMKTNK
jgi:glycosyltransferase involved in cell wall biosynthesis